MCSLMLAPVSGEDGGLAPPFLDVQTPVALSSSLSYLVSRQGIHVEDHMQRLLWVRTGRAHISST